MKICLGCGRRLAAEGWACPNCGHAPLVKKETLFFAPELAESNDGFEERYFAQLVKVEEGHFWFRSRNRLLTQMLRRFFPEARSFCEIGCGTGYVLSAIRRENPQLVLSGSDLLQNAFVHVRKRVPEASLFQMDARRIPFEEEFDVIGAFDVLEHVVEDDSVLSAMFRAIRPGGGILVTVPQHPFLWGASDSYSRHKRRYSRRELVHKIGQAGFQILHVTSFTSLLFPAMVASRMMQKKLPTNYDPMAEFRLSAFANAVLEKILTLERMAISRGISFPAGGSLLAVARRRP